MTNVCRRRKRTRRSQRQVQSTLYFIGNGKSSEGKYNHLLERWYSEIQQAQKARATPFKMWLG